MIHLHLRQAKPVFGVGLILFLYANAYYACVLYYPFCVYP